jgi:hypothetical protein
MTLSSGWEVTPLYIYIFWAERAKVNSRRLGKAYLRWEFVRCKIGSKVTLLTLDSQLRDILGNIRLAKIPCKSYESAAQGNET